MKNLVIAVILTIILVAAISVFGTGTGSVVLKSRESSDLPHVSYNNSDECRDSVLILPDGRVFRCKNQMVNNKCTQCLPAVSNSYAQTEKNESNASQNETGKHKYSSECGNNIVEEGEQCDGLPVDTATCTTLGYDSGPLGCNANCTYDTSMCVNEPSNREEKNNTEQGSEEENNNTADNSNENASTGSNNQTTNKEEQKDTIYISEIMYNPSGNENYNEWIELYNPKEATDLRNWKICGVSLLEGYIDTDGEEHLKTGFIVQKGKYVVITDGGSGTDIYDNLDVDEDSKAMHVDAGSLCGGLSNKGEKVRLQDADNNIIDEVDYSLYDLCDDGHSLIFKDGEWNCSDKEGGSAGS